MRKLLLFIFFITFGLFIFSADNLLEDIVLHRLEGRINNVLKGKTEIGKFYLSSQGFVFRHIYSYSDASKEASLVFAANKIVVPFNYFISPDDEFIQIKGLHLNVLLDEEYRLNLLRITKAADSTQKDIFHLPKLPIHLKVEDATFNCLLFIRGDRFLFKGRKTKAVAHIADNRIIYAAVSDGENIGECLSEGILDFNTLNIELEHQFSNIKLNDFSKRFLYSLFSFMEDFDYQGFVKINIKNSWRNKRIVAPKYAFVFKDTDMIHKNVPLVIDDIFGHLKISNGYFNANGISGTVIVDKLNFPVKEMQCQGDFTENNRVKISDISGMLFDGAVKGDVDVKVGDECIISAVLNDGDAKSFFTNMQSGFIPEKGFVDFEGDFTVTKTESKGWDTEGAGIFSVDNTDMGKIPFVLRLFSILDFSLPKKDNISNVYSKWMYADDNLQLDSLAIRGRKMGFYGEGVVKDLKELDVTLVARLREAKPFSFPPVIGDITRFASNTMLKTLATVKVTGTIDDPKFSK